MVRIEGLSYNPDTGEFIWVNSRKTDLNGKRAGYVNSTNGYRYIKHKGKNRPEHQLAWEYLHGTIPAGLEPDHINRIKTDNRISNLRLVTREENLINRGFAKNTCGARGVSKHKNGLYRARYKNKTLYFRSIEDAALGYVQMVEEHLAEIETRKKATEEANKRADEYLSEVEQWEERLRKAKEQDAALPDVQPMVPSKILGVHTVWPEGEVDEMAPEVFRPIYF